MRTKIIFIALATLFACVLTHAQQPGESPMEWFQRMDRNKDGRLSRQEVPSPRFKELSTDGDGFITLAEYKAFLNLQALKMLDRDADGKISQREFHQLYKDADSYFRTRQRLRSELSEGWADLRDGIQPLVQGCRPRDTRRSPCLATVKSSSTTNVNRPKPAAASCGVAGRESISSDPMAIGTKP